MIDDPRKPKIIIPDDANFLTLRKHKQTLDIAEQVKKQTEEALKKDKQNG